MEEKQTYEEVDSASSVIKGKSAVDALIHVKNYFKLSKILARSIAWPVELVNYPFIREMRVREPYSKAFSNRTKV